jgi:hypothetical protein
MPKAAVTAFGIVKLLLAVPNIHRHFKTEAQLYEFRFAPDHRRLLRQGLADLRETWLITLRQSTTISLIRQTMGFGWLPRGQAGNTVVDAWKVA